MDILAGDATVDQLFGKGYIHVLSDLYHLGREQLLSLEGWKEKSCENFLASVDRSRSVPFDRVLYALGIRHIGKTTAKTLAKAFQNIDSLAAAGEAALAEIEDIGPIVAASVAEWFSREANRTLIEELRAAGLQMAGSAQQRSSDLLEGKSIVVSGVFSISREELKALIEANGGTSPGSVSSKTSYLLAGDKPGEAKVKKAGQLGIEIIDEDTFYKMIGR
jgi:DNA ligase (NAD+)